MRIIDLQEIFEPSVSSVKTNREFKPVINPNITKHELGRGNFSIASDDPDDPHLIKKRQMVVDPKGMQDAFDLYADEIIKNHLWDNVHFPRIYSSKSIEDRTGKKLHKWKIERLSDFYFITDTELEYLVDRYVIPKQAKYIVNPDNLAHLIERAVRTREYSGIKDPDLKRALQALSEMYSRFKTKNPLIAWDIHSGNIMIRRTSVGIQLVITDPFAMQKPQVSALGRRG